MGAKALAEAVVKATSEPSAFKFLYDVESSITDKINTICTELYGAAGIELSGLLTPLTKEITKDKIKGSNFCSFVCF